MEHMCQSCRAKCACQMKSSVRDGGYIWNARPIVFMIVARLLYFG